MRSWTSSVVPIEAARCTPASLRKARRVSDLIAWGGAGSLDPNRLREILAHDTDLPPRHGLGLLLREPSGAHFLVTTSQMLEGFSTQPQAQRPGSSAPRAPARPGGEQAVTTAAQPPAASHPQVKLLLGWMQALHPGWFPATSLPHVGLAVVRIDVPEDSVCRALREAGYAFWPTDLLGDAPSRAGAEVLALEAGPGTGAAPHEAKPCVVAREGQVARLDETLPLFWTDFPAGTEGSGAPVIESERIVGIRIPELRPGVVGISPGMDDLPPSHAVAKAAEVKALLQRHANGVSQPGPEAFLYLG
jgi:hypothetical protein